MAQSKTSYGRQYGAHRHVELQEEDFDEEDEEDTFDVEEQQGGSTAKEAVPAKTNSVGARQTEPIGNSPLGLQPAYIRNDFVRKVYSILFVQLLLTAAIAFPFQYMSSEWLASHVWLMQAAQMISLLLVVGMACCCQEATRRFPTNYLLLFAFTAAEAVMIGFVTAQYQTGSVLLATGLTAAIFGALTCYAVCTKTDFTGFGPYLFTALMCMILLGFLLLFLRSEAMMTLYAVGGTLLFSFYIIYDTQLIVGGQHAKHQFGIDDYVFAALNLYLDIINLFLYLLTLFGNRNDS